jgi:hypothetical protein
VDGATTCYHEGARTGASERQPGATARAETPANRRKYANYRKRGYSRLPARQAGGHWFEPSTAHTKPWKSGIFRLLSGRRMQLGANSRLASTARSRLVPCDSDPLVLTARAKLGVISCTAVPGAKTSCKRGTAGGLKGEQERIRKLGRTSYAVSSFGHRPRIEASPAPPSCVKGDRRRRTGVRGRRGRELPATSCGMSAVCAGVQIANDG